MAASIAPTAAALSATPSTTPSSTPTSSTFAPRASASFSHPSSTLSPHFSPMIHIFTTPELTELLQRSRFHSLSHLLSAFENNIDKVQVRSTNYEPRLLAKFGVKLVERALPNRFAATTNQGATPSLAAGTTAPPPGGSAAPPPPPPPSATWGNTPFLWPTQAERDELFLDSLSSLITCRLQSHWTAQIDDKMPVRRPTRPRRRRPTDEEIAQDPSLVADDDVHHDPQRTDEVGDTNALDGLTPWYTTMRDEVFKRREMSETESFNSPIACLLALSSSHPDPLNAVSALWDLTSKENLFSPRAYPPRSGVDEDSRHEWANPDVLRYIVIVHDHGAGGGRDALEDAKDLHEQIRKTYGHHTALLPIFTAAPTAAKPEPRARGIASLWDESVLSQPGTGAPAHSQAAAIVGLGVDQDGTPSNGGYEVDGSLPPSDDRSGSTQPASPLVEIGHELSDIDFNSIKVFLREMVVQSIVPWIERSVVVAYEQYQASKKSIGGRLFSVGRKYFGGGTSGSTGKATTNAAGQPIGYNFAKGYYPFISQESQSRRLADLLFILHDYKLASTIYESLLKDYRADRASRHYASACRMMGLCLLLSQPTGQALTFNPDQYLEMAGASSSTTVDLDALKAMMLYYEVYLAIPDLRPAPAGLVRTAGETEEITSAVLLEQAALAHLRLPSLNGGIGGRKRKFGFHMIMAAKRYEKCGVKSLSRRCLNMTKGIYRGVGEGEQHGDSTNTDWWRDDVRYETFHDALGVEGKSGRGGWDAITNHLEHTLARQAYSVGKPTEAVGHFLQLIKGQNDDEDAEVWLDDFALAWERLSEQDRIEGHWTSPKRMWKLLGVWTGREVEIGSAGEEDEWETLEKDLGATESGAKSKSGNDAGVGETFYLELLVTNPLNASLAIGGLQISSDSSSSFEMEAPQKIELSPRETKRIYVPMRAHQLGPITFTHISYRFNDLLPCIEELQGRMKRLNATPEQQKGLIYTDDRSVLTVEIRSPVPSLSVDLEFLPQSMYAGEVKATSVRVTNIGHVALVGLQTMCSAPSFARFVSLLEADDVYAPVAQGKEGLTTTTKIENRLRPNISARIPLGEGQKLGPGESVDVPLVLRGDASGVRVLKWIFAYKSEESAQVLTSRATHRLEVLPSIEIRSLVQPSSLPSVPFLLAFEIHNQHIPGDLVISQIASLSPRWVVSMLPNVAFDDQFGPVGWQQSMSVVLAVHPVETDPETEASEDGHAFAVKQLNLLLQGRDVDKAAPGDVTLHLASVVSSSSAPSEIDTTSSSLLPSLLRTHTVLRHGSLSAQFRTIHRALHPHLFPLFNPRSLDLVMFWSSPSLDLQGHHHLADIPFGAGSNVLKSVLETAELKAGGLYAESQRERTALLGALRRSEMGVPENPVSVILQVDENLEHDFGKGPCTVPVTYKIRNLSPSQAFDYTLVLAPFETRSTTSLVYSGLLTHRGSVPPLGLATVLTQVRIMRQGVFDVGGWKVFAKSASGDERTLVGPRRELRVRDQQSHRPPPLTRRSTITRVPPVQVGA